VKSGTAVFHVNRALWVYDGCAAERSLAGSAAATRVMFCQINRFCQVGEKPSLPKLYAPLTAADLDLRILYSSGTYRERDKEIHHAQDSNRSDVRRRPADRCHGHA
jgi:hypothetical protein